MTTSHTILIVEDEKGLREILVDALKQRSFITLEAKNGQEGIDMALAQHPDLILLDLLMPGMQGMTALGQIRKDPWGKDVPVIIMTNLSATSEQIIEDMVTYKPLFYLIKSDWKIQDVVKKVEEILKM